MVPSPEQPEQAERHLEQDERFTPEVIEALKGPVFWEGPSATTRERITGYVGSFEGQPYFSAEEGDSFVPLSELRFSEHRQRELKKAGVSIKSLMGSPIGNGPPAETPVVETGFSVHLDNEDATRTRELYYDAPKSVRRGMEKHAEAEAYELLSEAEHQVRIRELEKARNLIEETTVRGGVWSKAETERELKKAERTEPESGDFERARLAMTADREIVERETIASERSPLPKFIRDQLEQHRDSIIETFAESYAEKNPKDPDAYGKARDRFVRILETGKVSGRNTGRGADRSFREYAKEVGGRFKNTWRNPNYRGMLGYRRAVSMGVRTAGEIIGFGLFAAGKGIRRGLETVRINRLLSEAKRQKS